MVPKSLLFVLFAAFAVQSFANSYSNTSLKFEASRKGDELFLTWQSASGQFYRLYHRETLEDSWKDVTDEPIMADSDQTFFRIPIVDASGFYMVEMTLASELDTSRSKEGEIINGPSFGIMTKRPLTTAPITLPEIVELDHGDIGEVTPFRPSDHSTSDGDVIWLEDYVKINPGEVWSFNSTRDSENLDFGDEWIETEDIEYIIRANGNGGFKVDLNYTYDEWYLPSYDWDFPGGDYYEHLVETVKGSEVIEKRVDGYYLGPVTSSYVWDDEGYDGKKWIYSDDVKGSGNLTSVGPFRLFPDHMVLGKEYLNSGEIRVNVNASYVYRDYEADNDSGNVREQISALVDYYSSLRVSSIYENALELNLSLTIRDIWGTNGQDLDDDFRDEIASNLLTGKIHAAPGKGILAMEIHGESSLFEGVLTRTAPDLRVEVDAAGSWPSSLVSGSGDSLPIKVNVSNDGEGDFTAGKLDFDVYAVPLWDPVSSGYLLDSVRQFNTGHIRAGATKNIAFNVQFPPELEGIFQVRVVVDPLDQVFEPDEWFNNSGMTEQSIEVAEGYVDLAVSISDRGLNIPSSVVAGDGARITLPVEISNLGNVPVPVGKKIVLEVKAIAHDPIQKPLLALFKNISVSGLRPEGIKSQNVTFELPSSLTQNVYYLEIGFLDQDSTDDEGYGWFDDKNEVNNDYVIPQSIEVAEGYVD